MILPWKALIGRHITTTQFSKGEDQKRRHLEVEEMREITVRAFQAYGSPLEMVTYFEYFGQILMDLDDDWPAVVRNIQKARKIWTRLSRILFLLREGVNIGLSGMFCKAVVQALLLFLGGGGG